jgi:DNA polymerase-3 subunit beta
VCTGDSGKSIIKTVPYDDFPSIPFPENPKNRIILPGVLLKNLFATIAPVASTSSVRPELASIYLSIEGGVLTAVTTDSFRLVEKKIPLTHKGTQGSFLIPAKNALEVSQALSDEETIVSFDDHQCAFVTPDIMIVSRLTNAVYPDYHQIIPKESVVEAILPRKTFEQALKRTTIFSDTFQKVRLQFDVQKQTCTFFARNTDIGESSDGVQGKITGSTLEISFNHRYLSTILSLTSTDQISFTAAGIGRPLLCRGVGDTSLLYLVSPMNQ